MTIPDILAEMRTLLHTRADLMRRIEHAESAAISSGGVGDGMPRGTAPEPKLERICVDLADMRGELAETEQELTVYRRKAEPLIERMQIGTPRLLLKLRYVEWMTMAEVARRAGYDYTNTYRALRNAEKILAS